MRDKCYLSEIEVSSGVSFSEKRRNRQVSKMELAIILGEKRMKFKNIILISMLVMMIFCVSAVSATDINSTDDITDDIAVDEISEVVEEVDIDDVSEDVVGEENLRQTETGTVNGVDYSNYFDTANGYTTTTNDLTFAGIFNAKSFGNFKINESITIDATEATFNNVGFDLLASNITLIGGTYYADDSVTTNAVIGVTGDNAYVTGTVISVNAPENQDFIAIDVANSTGTLIYDNNIYYVCEYPNLDNTNYVIRAKNSPNVNLTLNEITSVLPFKNVDYYSGTRSGMDMDLVAAIGIEESDNFTLYFNVLEGYIENTCEGYPTLDMVIICDSDNGYVGWNSIDEIDFITEPDTQSYLYAIDLYRCNNLTVECNELYLESDGGTFIPGTINGTSAAYGIQLTGPYTGVVIKNNTIDTKNNGPNAGIYSQNFAGYTSLQIINNTITVVGNASFHEWSLVTGMELQDDDVYIDGNTINVTNVGNYDTGHNAYGICFSQYYLRVPTSFVVVNNNIELTEGHYTVYIQAGQYVNVTDNSLISMDACGNSSVYNPGTYIVENNYCPQCDGVNCTCVH